MVPGSALTVDASIVIAVENPQDALHDEALSLVEDACDRPWIMHPITVTELMVGVARNGPAHEARTRIAQYRDWLERLGIDDLPSHDDAMTTSPRACEDLALLRARTRLKLPDCFVLQLALQSGTALATADRRLAEAAGAEGIETLLAAARES